MSFDLQRRLAHALRRVHNTIDWRCNEALSALEEERVDNTLWIALRITSIRRSAAQERSWRTVRRQPKGTP